MTEHSDHPYEAGRMAVIGRAEPASTSLFMPFDVTPYLHFIDDPSKSEAEKRQMAEALAFILIGIVDVVFGLHPAQQACGQLESGLASGPGTDSDRSNHSGQTLKQTFNKAAARRGRQKRKTP